MEGKCPICRGVESSNVLADCFAWIATGWKAVYGLEMLEVLAESVIRVQAMEPKIDGEKEFITWLRDFSQERIDHGLSCGLCWHELCAAVFITYDEPLVKSLCKGHWKRKSFCTHTLGCMSHCWSCFQPVWQYFSVINLLFISKHTAAGWGLL